ncbi:MAG: hypothetical protein HY926_11390 [Elusimicrobia bacterium]|nr:hypothetical protein [Elusimicrobiota bacterium]
MTRWLAVLILGLPLRCWSQSETVVVKVANQELKASALETGRGEEDVKDFESFLLVNMARRGVCLDKLGLPFYERLHRVLFKTAQQNPTPFHYFVVMAPQFDEKQVTDIFVVLRDAPEGFPSYVADQVRFFALMSAAPAPQGPAPALREEQVSEVAIREYERWLMHCGLFCPGKGLTGDPDGNTVDFKGDRTPWDLQGLFKGSAWDSGEKSSTSSPPVSAAGPLQASGPAGR